MDIFLGEVIDLKKFEIGLIRMLVHYYVCTSFGAVHKGRMPLPNRMIFWKNSKRPLTPPSFLENYIACFIMDMVAFMQGGRGQIVPVNICLCQLIPIKLLKNIP